MNFYPFEWSVPQSSFFPCCCSFRHLDKFRELAQSRFFPSANSLKAVTGLLDLAWKFQVPDSANLLKILQRLDSARFFLVTDLNYPIGSFWVDSSIFANVIVHELWRVSSRTNPRVKPSRKIREDFPKRLEPSHNLCTVLCAGFFFSVYLKGKKSVAILFWLNY